MVKIILKLKDKTISEIDVFKDTITIGRDPQNDVHIDNPAVSRFHAKIARISESAFYIDDLKSTNGTYVNEKRITWREGLKNNDVITIGKHSLIFNDDSGKAKAGSAEFSTIMIK